MTTDSSLFQIKRARINLRPEGSDVFRDVNNIESATYGFQDQTITKQSTSEVIGELARKTVSIAGTLTLDFGSTEWANFLVATQSTNSAQAAVTAASFTLPALSAGQKYKLDSVNINTVAIPGLVEGTDFQVFSNAGMILALKDITSAVSGCSYSAGLAKRGAFTSAGRVNYEVIVDDITNGEVHQFYKWSMDPAQNIALIKPNEFGMYTVTGSLLLDLTKPVSGVMGQFGVKYEIDRSA